ncbi:ROK family protein [Sediminibacillus halophilus]|uniref:Beta-glucoside kinase n=1 Tax=Sediminibacillus halophilus TaxID=482461 RepID=A0A1G9PDU0_9BACI|nr:ROK family protein [Sediminibacillus halophilus]SDL96387.1 beta-glucoside kinase [Sediminibacillus halophilus]
MTDKFIAFDVGGTKVKHSVILGDGIILEKAQYDTPVSDLERFLMEMELIIKQYRSRHSVNGIAISMPGPINPVTGYLDSDTAGNVVCIRRRSIKTLLEEKIDVPVEVENDGNCAALAEQFNGNAQGVKNFVCVTIGTGIGGGIVVDGKVLHGKSFRGGEFGFMITDRSLPDKAIWHRNGSTGSLIQDYRQFMRLDTNEKVEGQAIFQQAEQNEQCAAILDEWLTSISSGLYNLAVTLNPEIILVGGGVSAQADLLQKIETKLEQMEFWKDFRVPLAVCKHKNDAGMIGAVQHFLIRQGQNF